MTREIRAMCWWLAFAVAAITDAALTTGWTDAAFAFAASVGAFFAGLVATPVRPEGRPAVTGIPRETSAPARVWQRQDHLVPELRVLIEYAKGRHMHDAAGYLAEVVGRAEARVAAGGAG